MYDRLAAIDSGPSAQGSHGNSEPHKMYTQTNGVAVKQE